MEHYHRTLAKDPCIGGNLGRMRGRDLATPLPFETPRVATVLGFSRSEEETTLGTSRVTLAGDCFAFANLATLIGSTRGSPHPQRRNAEEVTARAVAAIMDNRCGCATVEVTVLGFWNWPFLWADELAVGTRRDREVLLQLPRHEADAVKKVLAFPLEEAVADLLARRDYNGKLDFRGVRLTNLNSYPERRLYGHCHALAYVAADLEFGDEWGNDYSILVAFLRQKLRTAQCGCSQFGIREHDAYAQAAHSRFQWKEEEPDEDESE